MMIKNNQVGTYEMPLYGREISLDRLIPLFEYIAVMEREFSRVEKIIGKELTVEAAQYYYDFYDLAHELKQKIKTITGGNIGEIGDGYEKLQFGHDFYYEMDRVSLFQLLTAAVGIDHYNHGFFEKKMKDKTILLILKALNHSFR